MNKDLFSGSGFQCVSVLSFKLISVWQRKEEQREKNIRPWRAIVKFDPSLRTAYCYKGHMLVGWIRGGEPNKGLHYQIKGAPPAAYCFYFICKCVKKRHLSLVKH